MTAGPDPRRREPGVPAAHERGFGDRHDPDEPRFAGPPAASVRAAPEAPAWPAEPAAAPYPAAPYPAAPYPAAQYPPAPQPPAQYPPSSYPSPYPSPGAFPPADHQPGPPAADLEPVVGYGPGVPFPAPARDTLLLSRLGSGVAAAGGVMAVIGSALTWATLRLTATGPGSQGFTSEPSSISYNGLSLLEGRVILVLGIAAIVLSAAALPRRAHRLIGFGLAATGGLAVVVMAFAAIGHPVELATLFRSYRQIGAVKVSLPNGVGTWLAVIGSLLVLAGGLLALMRGSEMQGEGRP